MSANLIVRALAAALLTAGSSAGQSFAGLSTTGDGSTLYFSTDLRQSGTDQSFWPKLFVANQDGIHLFLDRDTVTFTANPDGTRTSNPYRLLAPEVSDDGTKLAFMSAGVCSGPGSRCVGRNPNFSEVASSGQTAVLGFGQPSLSHNGRFLVRHVTTSSFLAATGSFLHDLASGTSQALPGQAAPGRRIVTDDGAVLLFSDSSQLVLWRAGPDAPIPIADVANVFDAEVNATGASVVYTQTVFNQPGSTHTIFAVNTVTGSHTQLAQVRLPPPDASQEPIFSTEAAASVSNDGETIVFPALGAGATSVHGLQVFAVHPDGSGLRQLTSVPEGISEVTISGDGKVAYATTFANGLFAVDVRSGEIHQVLGRTPVLEYRGIPGLAPGSFVQMVGTGLLDWGQNVSAQSPLPRSLGAIQLTVGGEAIPIEYVTPTAIGWQVPWNAKLDRLVFHQDNAPFEQAPIESLCCEQPEPQFFSAGGIIVAAHEAWDGVVTPERPARAGEIVHLYMTGLGAVSPPVATGEASPSDPPARITSTLTCEVNGNTADVLFAGLAPAMVGVYQVDIRMPRESGSNNGQIVVHLSKDFPGFGVLPFQP